MGRGLSLSAGRMSHPGCTASLVDDTDAIAGSGPPPPPRGGPIGRMPERLAARPDPLDTERDPFRTLLILSGPRERTTNRFRGRRPPPVASAPGRLVATGPVRADRVQSSRGSSRRAAELMQ